MATTEMIRSIESKRNPVIPHKFVQLGDVIVVSIDAELVKRFRLTDKDWVFQEEAQDGRIVMTLREAEPQ